MSNKYILSCINGYPPSQSVIDYGCWLTKLTSDKLKLFHTIDNQFHENTSDLSGSIGLGAREEMLEKIVTIEHEQNKLLQQKSKLILETGKLHAEKCGVDEVALCPRNGKVLDNILDLKDELATVVIGKYGKNHQGVNLEENPVGHKVENLIKKIELPILIVSEEFKKPESILLAFDGSKSAKKVLNFLCEKFRESDLKVNIVLFGENSEKNKETLQEGKKRLTHVGFCVNEKIIDDNAEDTLPDFFEDSKSDILAMGAFGHNFLHNMFVGSLTSTMIQKSKKPVLLLK